MACTTILVGKDASYDGSTIIARNEDSANGEFCPKRFVVVKPEEQPKHYRSVLSHIEIDLPDDPLQYTAVPNADLKEGIWGEAGVNEANVAMSATETLTTELAEERQRHDRLQDWDRVLTEQGEILKRLINGEWVDSCDVEAALGLTFAECVKRFEMNRIATWNPYPLNGQRVDVQFRIKKGEEPSV